VSKAEHTPAGIVADSSAGALCEQLAATWRELITLCATMTAEQWDRPTDCPGWTVADQVAHVVGTEQLLLGGMEAPAELAGGRPGYVHNDIGELNERWVRHYRGAGTEQLTADLRSVTAQRLDQLRAMDEAAFDAPSWTPIGQATYRRFMQIRVFDCWTHEQDVRQAIGRPGHGEGAAAEQALDEVVRALGYLVGKKAAAPEGSTVTFDITAPLRRLVHVAVATRAGVVDHLDAAATTVVRTSSDVFMRVACGRQPALDAVARGQISLSGDTDLGRQIATNLAFTI
jgi:uncharacterized protein (TIGR03083 family)